MASTEELQVVYEIHSPDMADDELYDYVLDMRDELLGALQEVLSEELPGAEARIEVARGSILLILIIAGHYVVTQGGAAVVGAAVVGLGTKGVSAIKRIFGRRPPPAGPNVTINVYVQADPESDPRQYEALIEVLAGMSDEDLEEMLEKLRPEQRERVRQDVQRRRGMGQGRGAPVPA